jgi:hypothetical protein
VGFNYRTIFSRDDDNDKVTGKDPVIGTFSAVGQSVAFTPLAERDFNIRIGTPGVALGDTIVLERIFLGASTWYPVTYPDGTIVSWTSGVNTSWSECEVGVQYRLNCTAWTLAATYRISQ